MPTGRRSIAVVETDHGAVRKKLVSGGRPLSSEELKQEDERVAEFINDPAQIAKQRKDGAQDDKRAEEMLRMLPDAFLWTVKSDDGEYGDAGICAGSDV